MIQQYYNKHAKEFINNTLNVDLKPIYERFEPYLKKGQKILDVGFGSGRDSLHFDKKGYEVVSIDFAEEIVSRGKILLSNEVLLVDVRDMQYKDEFHAIWASAVFLHLTEEEMLKAFENCAEALKMKGSLYVSFKYGDTEKYRHGRYFNDYNEVKFSEMISSCEKFNISEMWKTEDARPNKKGHYWLNVILKRKY